MIVNYCPFCGCEGIEITTLYEGNMEQGGFGWAAQCHCTQCQAQGSYNGGCETQEAAVETAIENWNDCGRKLWYHRVFDIWDGVVIRLERLFD